MSYIPSKSKQYSSAELSAMICSVLKQKNHLTIPEITSAMNVGKGRFASKKSLGHRVFKKLLDRHIISKYGRGRYQLNNSPPVPVATETNSFESKLFAVINEFLQEKKKEMALEIEDGYKQRIAEDAELMNKLNQSIDYLNSKVTELESARAKSTFFKW